MSTQENPAPENIAQNKEAKIQKLFAELKTAAENLEFAKADALREEIIATDPSALTQIIKSAEIIEEHKSANLDKDHLAIWNDLYQDLTEEETNALFYALKSAIIPPQKRILSHGGYNDKLFFIDKGQVTIFYPKDGKNLVLAQLGRGDLIGEYTFSTISLCSASAATTTEVQLKYLEGRATEKWAEEQPALLDKLISFCRKYGKVDDIITQKKLEKRNHPRYDIQGKVKSTLLTKEGKKTQHIISGILSNLSLVGCCFEIHLSKRDQAKALLARHFYYEIEFEINSKPVRFSAIGKIVRVAFHLHNDYSLHVKFVKPINSKIIDLVSS